MPVMIKTFAHKGLKLFFETGFTAKIQARHEKRLRNMLAVLNAASEIKDVDLPGYRLHSLSGALKGMWSITVNGNWRIIFKFENGNAYIVNYVDYH